MSDPSRTGLPCPECGYVIPMTMELLLTQETFYCTSCGLELTLNRQQSQETLDALARLDEQLAEAERLKRQALRHSR